MAGSFIGTNWGEVSASQGVSPGVADRPWAPWAGDPTPLSGDTPLVRQVNAIAADYRKRTEYLAAAHQAPLDAQAGLEALHQAYLEAVHQEAQAGETGTIASELRAKRDAGEREYQGTAWAAAIDGATAVVEQARELYTAWFEQNHAALLSEISPEGDKVTWEIAKVQAEYEAKLAALQARWGALWEDARKAVGYLHPYTRDDLPALGDYSRPPLPSAESIARHAALTAPVTVEPEPEYAEPITA
jgi:hypothetical protein